MTARTSCSSNCLVLVAAALALLGGCGDSGTKNEATLSDYINGIAVPPAPDAATNAATLAGVDTDQNGTRDDIDRRVATEFGTEPSTLAIAQQHAQRLNAVILAPGDATRAAYLNAFRCLQDETLLNRLSAQSLATLDTTERRRAFAQAMRGLVITTEGC